MWRPRSFASKTFGVTDTPPKGCILRGLRIILCKSFTWFLVLTHAAVLILAILLASESTRTYVIKKIRSFAEVTPQEAAYSPLYTVVDERDVSLLNFDGTVYGCESFLKEPNGSIITGASDGRILRIQRDTSYEEIVDHRKQGTDEDSSRPAVSRGLGITFYGPPSNGMLLVCDEKRGLLKLLYRGGDFKELQEFIPTGEQIVPLAKDVTEEVEGYIYVTEPCEGSHPYRLVQLLFSTGPCGRIFSIRTQTNEVRLLASDIHFASGLALSHDKKNLLVAEFKTRTLRKYPLLPMNNSKSTDWEVFSILPVYPDNVSAIRYNGRNFYLVVSCGTLFYDPPFPTALPEDESLSSPITFYESLDVLRLATQTSLKRFLDKFQLPTGIQKIMLYLLGSVSLRMEDFLVRLFESGRHGGGQIVVLDEQGELLRWISRKTKRFPRLCLLSSEAILYKPADEQFLLVGSFNQSQRVCKVAVGKYLEGI